MKHLKKINESFTDNDLKGLMEIKDTLNFILKHKYENDNNAIEEQISWLEDLINRNR